MVVKFNCLATYMNTIEIVYCTEIDNSSLFEEIVYTQIKQR